MNRWCQQLATTVCKIVLAISLIFSTRKLSFVLNSIEINDIIGRLGYGAASIDGDVPEPLKSITFTGCCKPAILRGDNKTSSCSGTCFTERACDDDVFPFRSAEERAALPQAPYDSKKKRYLRQECSRPGGPAARWCGRPRAARDNETVAFLVDGLPPAGCSLVSHGGGSGAFQHVLLFPSAKLAFCGIPKVGITQWEQFLRFYIGAKDYLSLPHYKKDREFFQFDKLDPKVQREIWEDRGWTWATLVRDPAERLLSGYMDKVVKGKAGKVYLKNVLKGGDLKPGEEDGFVSFEEFVDGLAAPINFTRCEGNGNIGLSWCTDPHWRPQIYSCGLSERLDRFQFVGTIENAADHARELLRHVGLWDTHGRHFVHGGRGSICEVRPRAPPNGTRPGFQQANKGDGAAASDTSYGHAKGSRAKMDVFYTPALLRKVREEMYADDYKLWRLAGAGGRRMSKGGELASKLSNRCPDP